MSYVTSAREVASIVKGAASTLRGISDDHVSGLLIARSPSGTVTERSITGFGQIEQGLSNARSAVGSAAREPVARSVHVELGVVDARLEEALRSVEHLRTTYPGFDSFLAATGNSDGIVAAAKGQVLVASQDGIHVRTVADAARSHHELSMLAAAIGS